MNTADPAIFGPESPDFDIIPWKGPNHSAVLEPEDRERFRDCIADLDLTIPQKDDLIDTVFAVLEYFVDRAFGVQPDQLAVRSASQSFNAPGDHGTICHPENQTARVRSDDVEADSNPAGPIEP